MPHFTGVPRPIIFLEKDTLLGVVRPPYNVPVISMRGQPSWSQMYEVSRQIGDREIVALVVTDFDRAGAQIEEQVGEKLRYFNIDLAGVERVALTDEQVAEHDLPTRPEKQYRGEAVELEALPPLVLRRIVNDAVEQRVSPVLQDWKTRRDEVREQIREQVRSILYDADGYLIPGAVWR